MRSWNGNIANFLLETIYSTKFSLVCFTERISNGISFWDIDSYENNWKSFHKFAGHGPAIYYQSSKISFAKEFPMISPIEIVPVLIRAVDTHMLIVLIYQAPSMMRMEHCTHFQFITQWLYWAISILIKDLRAMLVY